VSKLFTIPVILILVGVAYLSSAGQTAATWYYSEYTGYAFGNWNGSSGSQVYASDFANHSSSQCPGDPAAYWSFYTYIYHEYAIGYSNSDGTGWDTDVSQLRDTGDFSCTQSNYWVDIYFGRWRRSYEACNCNNGAVENCYVASNANACSDAINFGNPWRWYWGP